MGSFFDFFLFFSLTGGREFWRGEVEADGSAAFIPVPVCMGSWGFGVLGEGGLAVSGFGGWG